MFKHADPTRRTPTYLQNGTQENVIWQLKLLAVFLGFMWIKEGLEYHRNKKLIREYAKK